MKKKREGSRASAGQEPEGMTVAEARAHLAEMDERILMADGFEEALLGYVEVFSKTTALYDRERCIGILMKRDGMTQEDAEEYFDFNVTGSYVGDYTPAFATILRRPQEAKTS